PSAGATFWADGLGSAVPVFGTTLRAIGRGFGNGTFVAAARAPTVSANTPTLRARARHNALLCKPPRRTALLCTGNPKANRVTVLPRGESSDRAVLALVH